MRGTRAQRDSLRCRVTFIVVAHSADIDTFFGSDSFVVNGTFVKRDSLAANDTV